MVLTLMSTNQMVKGGGGENEDYRDPSYIRTTFTGYSDLLETVGHI